MVFDVIGIVMQIQQEIECGHPFPFGVTTSPVWTGKKHNSKPSDTIRESGAKPIVTWGGAFMSAGPSWDLGATTYNC